MDDRDDDRGTDGFDRRLFLKRTAIAGAALVWAVPTVETLTQVGAAASAPGSQPPPPPRCLPDKDDAWPAFVKGTPHHFHPGQKLGVYVWFDKAWHVRVTQPGHTPRHVFSGSITTRGKITQVSAVSLERDDRLSVSTDERSLTFHFVNHAAMLDGFDFSTRCADALHFDLFLDGQRVKPGQVFVGRQDTHPASLPFTVRRSEDPPR